MISHADDDMPREQSDEAFTALEDTAADALTPPATDAEPGLPASGIWLAALLRGDSPLMRCGY